jgi:hypothetical protein
MAADGKIKLGSCKHRRGANIPATCVLINVTAGVLVAGKRPNGTATKVNVEVKANVPIPATGDRRVYFSYLEPK